MNGKQWVGSNLTLPLCDTMPDVLGILGGRIRYKIVSLLARAPTNVGLLAEKLDLTVPHVSNNLGVLRRFRIVESSQIKREKFYRLGPTVEFQADGKFVFMRFKSLDGTTMEIRAPIRTNDQQ
jgi:DNA-binding transcriptional ArsR family regulator